MPVFMLGRDGWKGDWKVMTLGEVSAAFSYRGMRGFEDVGSARCARGEEQ